MPQQRRSHIFVVLRIVKPSQAWIGTCARGASTKVTPRLALAGASWQRLSSRSWPSAFPSFAMNEGADNPGRLWCYALGKHRVSVRINLAQVAR